MLDLVRFSRARDVLPYVIASFRFGSRRDCDVQVRRSLSSRSDGHRKVKKLPASLLTDNADRSAGRMTGRGKAFRGVMPR